MASRKCALCLRTLQRQSSFAARGKQSAIASKTFTTSRKCLGDLNPGPNATPVTSIPPVTPKTARDHAAMDDGPSVKKMQAELAERAQKGGISGTYTAYGITEVLHKECAQQADYTISRSEESDEEVPKTAEGEDLGEGTTWWHTEAGLDPTFSTWSQVTMLHMYLLVVRFRCFEPSISRIWQQHLLDHFFYDAENKMAVFHGMVARGTRNKYLKDMFIQWRGLLAAYDEGLAKNDAVLAAAVWRNVFKAKEDVDVRRLAQIVSYMRRTLKGLDSVDDTKVMMGKMRFGGPELESDLVALKSKMMDLPFERAPGKPRPAPKVSPK